MTRNAVEPWVREGVTDRRLARGKNIAKGESGVKDTTIDSLQIQNSKRERTT